MDMKQNMRWLAMILLLMFVSTVTSVILGHAIFISAPQPFNIPKEEIVEYKPIKISI